VFASIAVNVPGFWPKPPPMVSVLPSLVCATPPGFCSAGVVVSAVSPVTPDWAHT
jgi:hypothetical protein